MTSLATIHAMPDGDPCSLAQIERHQFIYFEGRVWVSAFPWLELVDITDNSRRDVGELWEAGYLFQPVRLVEASLNTNPEGDIQQ